MIELLLVEDQAMVRDALATLLDLEDDFHVVAAVANATQAIAVVEQNPQLTVALLDVEMPQMDGITLAQTLLQMRPQLKICMVTTFGKPGYVRRAFEIGASGFVVKDTPAAELADHIRQVAAGGTVLDSQLALESLTAGINPLTVRELEVLAEVAKGGSIDEIAFALGVSAGTVRNHVSAVLAKTGARNRAEAAAIAHRNGWLGPNV